MTLSWHRWCGRIKPQISVGIFNIWQDGEIKYQATGGREGAAPEYINFIKQLLTQSR